MLRDNAFPTDEERRWVIAKLLHIPPCLIGVHSLDELLSFLEKKQPPSTWIANKPMITPQDFTLDEYSHALKTYWKQNRADTLSPYINEIEFRIQRIEWEALYSPNQLDKQIIQLLCGYHMLRANIARDLQDTNVAIVHLNKADTLAKNCSLYKLRRGILCRLGGLFKERGEDFAAVHDLDAANRDFRLARDNYTLALRLDEKIAPAIQGSILLSLGKLKADQAGTTGTLHEAIKDMDKLETLKLVGKKADRNNFDFVEVDEERYHLNRAAAYLASPVTIACYPKDARRELQSAMAVQPSPPPKRRQAHNLMLEARSYIIEGKVFFSRKRVGDAEDSYAQAVKKTVTALHLVTSINSEVNLQRIINLYNDLKSTEYGKKSIDVAELEVALTLSGRINRLS